jgi:hypothetical protein
VTSPAPATKALGYLAPALATTALGGPFKPLFGLSGLRTPLHDLSSRPMCSWACGPPKVMKIGVRPQFQRAIEFERSAALRLVIPTEVEGPAFSCTVNQFKPRRRPQTCHPDRSEAKWRDLRCAYPPNNRILQQNPRTRHQNATLMAVTCTGSCEEIQRHNKNGIAPAAVQ